MCNDSTKLKLDNIDNETLCCVKKIKLKRVLFQCNGKIGIDTKFTPFLPTMLNMQSLNVSLRIKRLHPRSLLSKNEQ